MYKIQSEKKGISNRLELIVVAIKHNSVIQLHILGTT